MSSFLLQTYIIVSLVSIDLFHSTLCRTLYDFARFLIIVLFLYISTCCREYCVLYNLDIFIYIYYCGVHCFKCHFDLNRFFYFLLENFVILMSVDSLLENTLINSILVWLNLLQRILCERFVTIQAKSFQWLWGNICFTLSVLWWKSFCFTGWSHFGLLIKIF